MSRLRPVKTNFTNGEVDPLITMRSDLELFVNGASRMRNVFPFPQGGFRRRDGLEFMTLIPPGAQVKPIGAVGIGINAGGTGYVKDDNLTLSGGTGTSALLRVESVSGGVITGIILIDAGDYTVAPSSPAGHTGGSGTGATFTFDAETQEEIQEVDFTFSVDQNYLIIFTVSRGYIFRKEDTGSGPNQLVEQFLHPYSNEDLPDITWTQSLDVMLVFHKNHATFQLTRTAETVWTWDTFEIINPPSFAFGVRQTVTMNAQVTATFKVGDIRQMVAEGSLFSADNVGDYIRIFGSVNSDGLNNSSFYKIETFTNGTTVQARILVAPIATGSFTVNGEEWLLEEPEWSFARGYPRCGTFFQGRLSLAGSRERSNTFWASRAGDINDFNNGGSEDDLGISLTADSGDISTFQNIYPGRHLQIFADSSEFYIPVSELEPITPSTASLRRTSSVGSRGGIPVFEIDGVVYFVQRGGESLRQFIFVDDERAYSSDIVSLFSGHLIRNPGDAAFKKSKSTEDGNYIWIVNDEDGSLTAFSLLRSELINAWSLQTTKGTFKGVAVLDQGSYFHTKRFPGGLVEFTDRFFSVEPETTEPHGLVFNNDGAKFFICAFDAGGIGVYEYDLAEPFTLNGGGASYPGKFFSTAPENSEPRAIQFSADGRKMFILGSSGSDTVYEYTLTLPFSMATGNVVFSGNSFDVSAEDNSSQGLHFSPDGLKMYTSGAQNSKVYEYDLTLPFSMAGGNVVFSGDDFSTSGQDADPEDVTFSADGTRMYIAGGVSLKIHQYFLSTAFSIASATYSDAFLDVSDQETVMPLSIAFSEDGSTLFLNGTNDEKIFEYSFDQPFKIGIESDSIEFFNRDLRFDSGVIAQNISTPVTSVSGLDFLENETIELIIDKIFYGEFEVSDGGVLEFPFIGGEQVEALDSYQFGMPFPQIVGEEDGTNVLVETLPADILLPEGTTMGRKKRVSTCSVRVVETQGFYLQNVQVPFRQLPFVLGKPVDSRSGDFELKGLLGWNLFGQIKITQKEPLDMTVLGLGYDINTRA